MLAVRADHLVDLAVSPALSRLAEQNLHLLSTLAGDALRDAIVKPAEAAGLRLEPGLVELIMRDTEGEPGALPLMSHALVETWRCREGNVLTAEGYRATGGIRGAVARSADRLYESLPPSQRRVLRSMLLRLVIATADGAPTRTRVPSRVLRGDSAHEHVLALLIVARLVTTSDEVVEMSHEALARAWPRLRAWLDEDSAALRGLRHLAAAADGWDSLGRPESELYRGARLEAIDEYRQTAHPDMTRVDCDFLDASMQQAQTDRIQLRHRVSLDARRTRRLRILLAATASLLVMAVLAVVAARNNARDARAARDDTRLEAVVNRSLALRPTDRDVAALLAVEAVRRWPGDPRARSALFGTFTAAPGFLGNRYVPNAQSLLGLRIPHTSTAVLARDGTYLQVRDLDTGELVHTLPTPHLGNVEGKDVAVSGDGRRVAHLLACADGRGPCAFVLVYDLTTGQPIGRPIRLAVSEERIAISDDGTVLAVASARDGAVTVFTAEGTVIAGIPSQPRPNDAVQVTPTGGVAFGPDGLLYVGTIEGPIRVIDPHGGRVLRTLAAPAYFTNVHVHIGADGIVVAVGQRGMLSLDAITGRIRWAVDLRGKDPDPCPWFAASETAGHLYCGSHYGDIEERSRATGQRTGVVLDTQLGDVGELSLSDDGGEIAAFGADSPAISRWRLDGGGPIIRQIAPGHVTGDGFDFQSGTTLVVARRTKRATIDTDLDEYAVWDTISDGAVDNVDRSLAGAGWFGPGVIVGYNTAEHRLGYYTVHPHTAVDGPTVGPDCDHLWVSARGARSYWGGIHGEVWTFDPATRHQIDPTLRLHGWVRSVSATRHGERIVVTTQTDSGGLTTVHDGRTGALLAGPLHGPDITSVSLDGQLVGSSAGRITRYDLNTLKPLGDLPGAHGEINTLQWSDDGSLLLATSNDKTVSLYDARTSIRLGDRIATDAPFIYPGYLSHDGRSVALTDARGVALWDLDTEHLRVAACAVAGRNLTRTEWKTYLPGLDSYRATCPGLLVPRR